MGEKIINGSLKIYSDLRDGEGNERPVSDVLMTTALFRHTITFQNGDKLILYALAKSPFDSGDWEDIPSFTISAKFCDFAENLEEGTVLTIVVRAPKLIISWWSPAGGDVETRTFDVVANPFTDVVQPLL